MALPAKFLGRANFRLAFDRVQRSSNGSYKAYFRHLLAPYSMGLDENLDDLRASLKSGTYGPSAGEAIYLPKKSGILRPLTLLTMDDLVVYQAMVNIVADAFRPEQAKLAGKRRFGALLAGPTDPYLYRPWAQCYQDFGRAQVAAFRSGRRLLAEFDLVAFYELVDHTALRRCLERRVTNRELLDLLFRCLGRWAPQRRGDAAGHGIPQGPDGSALLAECFLFCFDEADYERARYFRYVDDVRILAGSEAEARRCLVKLDLLAKQLGLVPQAQKVACRRIAREAELLKTVPSGPSGSVAHFWLLRRGPLLRAFRSSLAGRAPNTVILDDTRFKFSLARLPPHVDVLRRIAPLFRTRADLSWVLSRYAMRFRCRGFAEQVLVDALKASPGYAVAQAHVISALASCETQGRRRPNTLVVRGLPKKSVEGGMVLGAHALWFRLRRAGAKQLTDVLGSESNPRVKGLALALGLSPQSAPLDPRWEAFLIGELKSPDADYARFCAAILAPHWNSIPRTRWLRGSGFNRSVLLLQKAIGLRRRVASGPGVLDLFFGKRYGIGIQVKWRAVLGLDFRDAEQRCIRLQRLLAGDPSTMVVFLDTFNELLVQCLCRRHSSLGVPFAKAAGKQHHPDFGNWIGNGPFKRAFPVLSAWLNQIHNARVNCDLAHAKAHRTGLPTRPVSYKQAARLLKGAAPAWAEMMRAFRAEYKQKKRGRPAAGRRRAASAAAS